MIFHTNIIDEKWLTCQPNVLQWLIDQPNGSCDHELWSPYRIWDIHHAPEQRSTSCCCAGKTQRRARLQSSDISRSPLPVGLSRYLDAHVLGCRSDRAYSHRPQCD